VGPVKERRRNPGTIPGDLNELVGILWDEKDVDRGAVVGEIRKTLGNGRIPSGTNPSAAKQKGSRGRRKGGGGSQGDS